MIIIDDRNRLIDIFLEKSECQEEGSIVRRIIVALLVVMDLRSVEPLENLARALREIALSASVVKSSKLLVEDWNFKLSDINLASAAPDELKIVISTLANQSLDPSIIASYMATRTSPVFPLTECPCALFKRDFINETSIRTSYEQLVIRKLVEGWTTKKEGKVAYISVGSGGLLTDFSIADQFLDKVPNADLTIHAVDSEYARYIGLLDFCKGEPFLTEESIVGGWPKHGSVQLGWSLNNPKSTKDFAAKYVLTQEKESIIKDLIIPHEQFQRFLYLLKKRHPNATVKLELWNSIDSVASEIKEIAPDFIGSIDALEEKGGKSYYEIFGENPGPDAFDQGVSEVQGPIFTDFKKLCADCIKLVSKACNNLAVGRYKTNVAVLLGRFIHKDNFDPNTTDWDYLWFTDKGKIIQQKGDIITLMKAIKGEGYYAKITQDMINALK